MLSNVNYKFKAGRDLKQQVAFQDTKEVRNRFRFSRANRNLVCKYWLRGVCKRGELCDFSHEFDIKRIPECHFYSRFKVCLNKECHFLHIEPENKIKPCYWYDRGFCPEGPRCQYRHVRRVLCLNYMDGFCPLGDACKNVHLPFDLPHSAEPSQEYPANEMPNNDRLAKKPASNHHYQVYNDSTDPITSLQRNKRFKHTPENISDDSGNGESSDTSSN